MAEYTVNWSIQIEADDEVAAARQALAIQRDPDSTATVFDVEPFWGQQPIQLGRAYTRFQVDLSEEET